MEVQQISLFDYDSLDIDTRVFVQRVVNDTHLLVKQTDENIIQIGKNLQALKDRLPHGQFLPLLQIEFGWTERTAQNFMNYARLIEKNERLSYLPREVGYVLGQKSMPDEVLNMVEAGQISPTLTSIREAKREIQQEGQQQSLTTQPFIDEVPSRFTEQKQEQAFSLGQWQRDNVELGLDEWGDVPEREQETQEDEPVSLYVPPTQPLKHIEPLQVSRVAPEVQDTPVEPATKSATLTALQSSESNEWFTPSVYIEAARALMGEIDLDPASNAFANQIVQAATYYDIDANGLDKPWYGRIWLNPPYGRDIAGSNQEVWSHRLIEQYQSGITKEAILLVNANTEARWFQPLYEYLICFTNHRIRFYNNDGTSSQPTQGNAFVYFGSQQEHFVDIFQQFGVVVRRVG